MNRSDFLSLIGLGTGAVLTAGLGGCLSGCKKDDTAPPSGVDFTLDLTDPANAALGAAGGYVYRGPKDGIIVARTAAGTYLAAARRCTHQQTTLEFRAGSTHFVCPDHHAEFVADGTVARAPDTGPATPLKTYKVVQTGNTLRITG